MHKNATDTSKSIIKPFDPVAMEMYSNQSEFDLDMVFLCYSKCNKQAFECDKNALHVLKCGKISILCNHVNVKTKDYHIIPKYHGQILPINK